MKKIITIISALMLFLSCKNKDYRSNTYGEIIDNDIVRIEYFKGNNYLNPDANKKPDRTITDLKKITKIVTEINNSNNPGPWKGAQWDKVVIVKKDTILTFSTNGKVIGINHSSGIFYELKDEQFIKRYFQN